jgi:hypothetical protein
LFTEESVAWVLTVVALVCTWVPFYKAIRVCLRGWSATRRVDAGSLRQGAPSPRRGETEPLATLMMRILRKSLKEQESNHPTDFVFDASRHYVMDEFEVNYTRLITMFGSLLPPIGFIGTTGGMLILFLSMQVSDSSLELGALALALTSSIFALIGFSILEGLKIRLYGRLLVSLRDVQILFDEADQRREASRDAA